MSHSTTVPAARSRLDLATPEEAVDQIFLTPRVVDRRSFEEFSATLQELIRQAAGQSHSLRSTKTDAGALEGQLREAGRELQQRIDKGAKLLPALEQRLARAEKMIEMAIDPAKHAEAAEKLIAERMAIRAADFEQRLARAIDEIAKRLRAEQDTIEAKGREVEKGSHDFALRAARAVEEVAAQTDRQAVVLEHKTDELTGVLRAELERVVARIGDVQAKVDETAGHAQEAKAILDHHATGLLDAMQDRAQEVTARSAKARAELEHRAAGLLASISTAGETIGTRLRDLDAAAAGKIDELTGHGDTIREGLNAQGERVVARLAEQLDGQRTLMADLEREIEARVTRGDALLVAGLKELADHTDLCKSGIDRHAAAAAETFKTQAEALSDLRREVDERVRHIEAAAAMGVDRVQANAAAGLDDLARRAADLLADIREETRSITTHQVQIAAAGKRVLEQIGGAAIQAATSIEQQRGQATGDLDAQRAYIVEQRTQIEQVLTQAEQTLGPLIQRGQETMAGLEGRLRETASAASAPASAGLGQLQDLVARADAARAAAEAAARQFEAMQRQAEQARSMLSDAIMAAAGWIDAMEERRGTVMQQPAIAIGSNKPAA